MSLNSTQIKIITVAIVAIIIGVVVMQYLNSKKTDEAPDFTVTDTEGDDFTLSEFRDNKVVLLDFMSVSCASCEDEMPILKDIYAKYGNQIVMLSVDVGGDTNEELENYMDDHDADWRAAIDTDDVMGKYGITSFVRVMIVDKDGKITYDHVGVSSFKKLSKEIDAAESGEADSVKISSGMGLATLAIGAGIFAFFSPCAFPMLPGYMSFYLAKSTHAEAEAMAGDHMDDGSMVQWDVDEEERKKKEHKELLRKGMFSGIATALGIVFLYLIIGVLVSISGELVKSHMSTLEPIIGFVLIALGIMMVENIPIGQHMKNMWMYIKYYAFEKRKEEAMAEAGEYYEPQPGISEKLAGSMEGLISKITRKDFSFEEAKEEGYFGLFVFGIGYGAASASCCFPLFLAIIIAALDAGGAANGFYIFLLYALSMATLMIVVTILVSVSRNTILNRMRSATGKIEMFGGISLQIVGIYLIWYSLNG